MCVAIWLWTGQFSIFAHCTGATYIKKMLIENKSLKLLDISYNSIGDDGMRNVSEGITQNDTLIKLTLYDCEISVKGNYS